MNTPIMKARKVSLLKGGVIFEASSPDEAIMATRAGGKAIVAKDPNPQNKCMCDPSFLYKMIDSTPLPVIARVRTGHFVEAQLMELAGANLIDESRELELNNYDMYINMAEDITAPGMVPVSTVLDIARAVTLGASAIYLNGSGDPTALITAKNKLFKDMAAGLKALKEGKADQGTAAPQANSLFSAAGGGGSPQNNMSQILGSKDGEYRNAAVKLCQSGKIPLPLFAHNAVATPLDAALLMDEGFYGIIVVNNLFADNVNPVRYANAFVKAVNNYNKSDVLTRIAAEMGRGAYGAAAGGRGGPGNVLGGFTGGVPKPTFGKTMEESKETVKKMSMADKLKIAKQKLAS